MDRIQKASEPIERAEKLGLRLEFDSGLILVKRTVSGDPERQDAIIVELRPGRRGGRRLISPRWRAKTGEAEGRHLRAAAGYVVRLKNISGREG
jgi:hypothetical protein